MNEVESDPDVVLARLLCDVATIADAPSAGWYSAASIAGVPRVVSARCSGVAATKVAEYEELTRGSSSYLPSGLSNPGRPRPRERRRFLSLGDYGAAPLEDRDPVLKAAYELVGIGDHARLLVYHGDRFIGWIGAIRPPRARPFSRRDAARLDRISLRVRAAMIAADSLLTMRGLREAVSLVVRGDGRVEHTTTTGRAWLDRSPHHAAEVAALARRMRRAKAATALELGAGAAVLTDANASVVRLVGERSERLLVTLAPHVPVYADTLSMLSPTLRNVADLAAAGATGPEIAAALRIRPDSARAYVAEVYRRLDVGSRVELASLLASRECALRAET